MDTCMTVWHWATHARWYDEGLKITLNRIRDAGFTHINWNPDAGSSYWYAASEIDFISGTIRDAGLKTKTVHASNGVNTISEHPWLACEDRKDIHSPNAWQRQAAVELLENRVRLAAALNAPDIVLHINVRDDVFTDAASERAFFEPVFATLDALQPTCLEHGVKVAVENLFCASAGSFLELYDRLFARYSPDFLGLCYDSGHWEMLEPGGLSVLERFGDRLITTHIHDNFSAMDDHLLPFDGRIDWQAVVNAIAATPYETPLNFETPQDRYGLPDSAYYARAHQIACRLEAMIADARGVGQA